MSSKKQVIRYSKQFWCDVQWTEAAETGARIKHIVDATENLRNTFGSLDQASAEAIYQQAFATAKEKLPHEKTRKTVDGARGYIYGIMKNLAKQDHRDTSLHDRKHIDSQQDISVSLG